MLRLTKISKSFGGQVLFRDVDWFVERRDRVALIGTNGSGKSTLLKMIAGLENADRGTIELPRSAGVGYLAQQGFLVGRGTVREEAREAFQAVLALQGELLEVEAELKNVRPEDPGVGRLAQRHHEILERLAILGADDIEREIHRVLTGLGFRDEDFDRPVEELSGGWQMRVALARILLQKPELLLLDEPTNHLDLEAREWLESYLQEYPHAFVLVSHDRYFLDVTVKRTTEIAEQGLDNYAGNYSLYERERDKRYELRLKAYERQQEEIRRLEQFIARNRANKKLAGRTHSRMLVLEKMVRLTPPASPRVGPRIRFPQCPASGRVALELRGVAKSYGAKRVFSGLDLAIMRGARVALVGPNGAGKSTLMRLLSGREAPDRGEWVSGHQTQIAFFAQDEGTRIDPGITVHEAVLALAPTDFVPEVRGLLGAFLFSGDAVEKRVSALSGGELNRLAIACLLVRPSNLLLLDEPTNHLDLAAKEALLTSLAAYPGTVVFVSHDRHFLENLSTHVVEVGHGRIVEYPGSYASYLYRRDLRGEGPAGESVSQGAPQAAPPERAARAAKQAEQRTPPRPNAQATRDAEMRRAETQASEERNGARGAKGSRGREASPARGGKPGQADQRRLRDIRAIEASIEELEDRKARFGRALANPVLYADQEKSTFYLREIEAVERKLAELYRKWEHLQGGSR